MLEGSPRIIEDITDGEEPRVIIVNPRRYISPVVTPLVFAAADHAGVPVREISFIYNMRNPRQFFSNFMTRENATAWVTGFIEGSTINYLFSTLGVPVLPVHIAYQVAKQFGHENSDWLIHLKSPQLSFPFGRRRHSSRWEDTLPLLEDAPAQNAQTDATPCCGDSLSSFFNSFKSLIFWRKTEQVIPLERDIENSLDNTPPRKSGKYKTD